MSKGLNEWRGIGNVVQDSALRFTSSQQAVLGFRIACTEDWLDKQSNERKERTEFVNCTLWGKRGESLHKILDKGTRVHVSGRLETTSWDDKKTGEKRYGTQIVVSDVILLGGGKGKSETRGDSQSESRGNAGADSNSETYNDDDIPF